MNITDREAVSRLPEAVIQIHGTVESVINNAGIFVGSDANRIDVLSRLAHERAGKMIFSRMRSLLPG